MTMERRFLDYDPETKLNRWFYYDHDTGEWYIAEEADVQEVADVAKESYASTDERARWGEGQRVASIPCIIWQQLVEQGIADDDKALRKWLDDPDNQVFRTRPGRISRGRK